MSQQQLVPVNLYTAASNPTTPNITTGDLYYNTSTGVRVYDGSNWVAVGGGYTIAQTDALFQDSNIMNIMKAF